MRRHLMALTIALVLVTSTAARAQDVPAQQQQPKTTAGCLTRLGLRVESFFAKAFHTGLEFVDDGVLDPMVRAMSRHALAAGKPGTPLTGTIKLQEGGPVVLTTAEGVAHEIIGASDPALLQSLSSPDVVGKTVTLVGFADPLSTDFVAWSVETPRPSKGLIEAMKQP